MLCQCFLPAVSMPGSADLSTHPRRRGNLLALTPLWHIPLLEQDRMTSVAVHRLILKVLWAATVDQELDANGDTTQGCVNGSKQDSVTPDPKDTSAGNCRAVHSSPWHFYSCKQTDCSSSEPHCSSFFAYSRVLRGTSHFLKHKLHKTSSLPRNHNSGCWDSLPGSVAYFPWPEYVNTDCSVQLCAAIPSCSSLSSKGSPVLPLEQPIRYVWEFKCSEYSTVEFSAIISHAGTTVSIWFFKAWTSNGWSELKAWDTTFFSGCQGPAAQRTQTLNIQIWKHKAQFVSSWQTSCMLQKYVYSSRKARSTWLYLHQLLVK